MKVKEALSNLIEGLYTGMDPLGLALGHILKDSDSYLTKDKRFLLGYFVDKYGLSLDRAERDEPKTRTNIDQAVKGVGTAIGLTMSPMFDLMMGVGYTTVYFRDKYKQKKELQSRSQPRYA